MRYNFSHTVDYVMAYHGLFMGIYAQFICKTLINKDPSVLLYHGNRMEKCCHRDIGLRWCSSEVCVLASQMGNSIVVCIDLLMPLH